ncbi:polymorphic toxin type 4 domain-containing protein [Haloechinothrix halophila]|uniref:polymorphic toxin type 4 domain-containing protein n=1 Tax=Haloechinothrix halophila TaxID=1069073 RepID=UPI0005529CCD|nr:polymorphic toxin type 4 domain-containing protein [Haloechinothrix halophila]
MEEFRRQVAEWRAAGPGAWGRERGDSPSADARAQARSRDREFEKFGEFDDFDDDFMVDPAPPNSSIASRDWFTDARARMDSFRRRVSERRTGQPGDRLRSVESAPSHEIEEGKASGERQELLRDLHRNLNSLLAQRRAEERDSKASENADQTKPWSAAPYYEQWDLWWGTDSGLTGTGSADDPLRFPDDRLVVPPTPTTRAGTVNSGQGRDYATQDEEWEVAKQAAWNWLLDKAATQMQLGLEQGVRHITSLPIPVPIPRRSLDVWRYEEPPSNARAGRDYELRQSYEAMQNTLDVIELAVGFVSPAVVESAVETGVAQKFGSFIRSVNVDTAGTMAKGASVKEIRRAEKIIKLRTGRTATANEMREFIALERANRGKGVEYRGIQRLADGSEAHTFEGIVKPAQGRPSDSLDRLLRGERAEVGLSEDLWNLSHPVPVGRIHTLEESGIMHSPKVVNQKLQNQGIESMVERLTDLGVAEGFSVNLKVVQTGYPAGVPKFPEKLTEGNIRLLKKVDYRVTVKTPKGEVAELRYEIHVPPPVKNSTGKWDPPPEVYVTSSTQGNVNGSPLTRVVDRLRATSPKETAGFLLDTPGGHTGVITHFELPDQAKGAGPTYVVPIK